MHIVFYTMKTSLKFQNHQTVAYVYMLSMDRILHFIQNLLESNKKITMHLGFPQEIGKTEPAALNDSYSF